jgi:hypothetical protein
MPQNTVLPQYRATYPYLASVQKPPGLNPPISTTLDPNAVPNKHRPAVPMILSSTPTEE